MNLSITLGSFFDTMYLGQPTFLVLLRSTAMKETEPFCIFAFDCLSYLLPADNFDRFVEELSELGQRQFIYDPCESRKPQETLGGTLYEFKNGTEKWLLLSDRLKTIDIDRLKICT